MYVLYTGYEIESVVTGTEIEYNASVEQSSNVNSIPDFHCEQCIVMCV